MCCQVHASVRHLSRIRTHACTPPHARTHLIQGGDGALGEAQVAQRPRLVAPSARGGQRTLQDTGRGQAARRHGAAGGVAQGICGRGCRSLSQPCPCPCLCRSPASLVLSARCTDACAPAGQRGTPSRATAQRPCLLSIQMRSVRARQRRQTWKVALHGRSRPHFLVCLARPQGTPACASRSRRVRACARTHTCQGPRVRAHPAAGMAARTRRRHADAAGTQG